MRKRSPEREREWWASNSASLSSWRSMAPSSVPLSIVWTWKVTGEFDTSNLSTGTTYEVDLPLKLNGKSYDGWGKALTLDLALPQGQGPKPQPNIVPPRSIPLGQYKDFAFPKFTSQGSGSISISATTEQYANLPSALLVADAEAKIKGTDFIIPLTISWSWEVIGQFDGNELSQGSKYEVGLPLKLNGDTRDGWSQALSLQTTLPPGQNTPPPKSVNPSAILLNSYKDFPFPSFTAQGPGSIQLRATTQQGANLPSSLLVADEQAHIKQV